MVSTHSRPKAAANQTNRQNYQKMFQHTAARRRLRKYFFILFFVAKFQHTAARRRLRPITSTGDKLKCFNTQPPEGGCIQEQNLLSLIDVSTHSRPKAAANQPVQRHQDRRFQHTAARRRLHNNFHQFYNPQEFQHTAARRRLLPT